jgi:prolyl oligopeptidase
VPDDSQNIEFLINPVNCQLFHNQLILNLASDWVINKTIFTKGSLVSVNFAELLKGEKKVSLILEPDHFTSVSGVGATNNKLLVNVSTNVKNDLYLYAFKNDKWEKEKVNAPAYGTISLTATDEFSDRYFFTFTSFLIPSTLYIGDAKENSLSSYKSLPAYFNAAKFKIEQFKARSKDGTMVPYFVVSPQNINYNSKNPVLMYAYGAFGVSVQPSYSGTMGYSWLEQGGIYVLANIRGGGEFGPKWHQAAIKEKKQNSYDDFYAVAEDLIAKNITSCKNLGMVGESNGGLLVGVAFTQRPDLFNAVVCSSPLLDMKRYTQLLAGASWMGEYGDPAKLEEWEYIKKYSP